MSNEKLEVLFICDTPGYRSYKIAKGLLLTGECNPNLLSLGWDEKAHSSVYNETKILGNLFSQTFNINKLIDFKLQGKTDILTKPFFKKLMKKSINKFLEVQLIHTIAPPVSLCKLAIETSPVSVIFDQYDLILQSYGDSHKWEKEVDDERYCLENADAFVHKGPKEELDFYRNIGYSLNERDLTYPDGCDEDIFEPTATRKLRDDDNEWHIVYVGGIHGAGKCYYLLPVFKRLMGQSIHLHVYPASWSFNNEDLREYYNLAQESKYFHMNRPIPYTELLKELSSYDFGLYYFDMDPKIYPGPAGKQKTAAGNKIPTYFEAGLPVMIGEKLEYSKWFITESGAGFVINDMNLDNIKLKIESLDMKSLRSAVDIARNKMSLKKQGKALLEFYWTILEHEKI